MRPLPGEFLRRDPDPVDAGSGFEGPHSWASAPPGDISLTNHGPHDSLLLRVRNRGEIPLRYWSDGSLVYVVVSRSARRWPAAVRQGGACEVEVENHVRFRCAATWVTDSVEAGRARAEIRGKYGTELWDRHFGSLDRVLRLDPRAPPVLPTALERIRNEFDAVAPAYTQTVEGDPFKRYLKHRTASFLVTHLSGVDPLLEIGPGTGFETLPLLAAGHRIVAVDISERMLTELTARARAHGLADRLTTRVGSLGGLGPVLNEFGASAFGAAYSTFGAFNLEPDVRACAPILARAIRPGGRLVFTSLNRPGATPVTYELLLGHAREAWTRMRRSIPADGFRFSLDVFPRNPGFWDDALEPSFDRWDTRPVSVLAPPFESPRAVHLLGERGRRNARALDAALSGRGLLSPLAEWVLLTYRRRAEEARPTLETNASGSFS